MKIHWTNSGQRTSESDIKWKDDVRFWWFCWGQTTRDNAVEHWRYETVGTVPPLCSPLSVHI